MKRKHKEHMLPLSKALLYIFLTTVIVSGSATLGWLYYLHLKHDRAHDDDYLITAIVQTGPEKEALPTQYLAELLDLSADAPTNLYELDLDDAVDTLLTSPLIKGAEVHRVRPSTLYIDYTRRTPIAYLLDYDNTVVDADGIVFPATPFFTPKRIPQIVLGNELSVPSWGERIHGREAALAFAIYRHLDADPETPFAQVRRIDVSEAFAESYGSREVVVIIEKTVQVEGADGFADQRVEHTLRLNTERWQDGIANYNSLQAHLATRAVTSTIVDLRVPQIGLLAEQSRP